MDKILKYTGATGMAAFAYIEPNFPMLAVCIAAIFVDAWTAWRLAKRLQRKTAKEPITTQPTPGCFIQKAASGKFKSTRGEKVFNNVIRVFMFVILANMIEKEIFYMVTPIYLANWTAGAFCFNQIWSVFENESSSNPDPWARILQRIMVDKTERHLDIDLSELKHKDHEETAAKN